MFKYLILALLAFTTLSLPNQRPIIGVYTQSDEDDQPHLTQNTFHTYIAASYIKFIEMSGAQVVPIFAYSKQSEIAALLPKLNGVLFPGGGQTFDMKLQWTSNANYILQYAMKQNDQGNIFPVWGTCLGFQLLAYLTSNYQNVLSPVRGQTAILNTLYFPGSKGYIFETMPDRLITKLTTGQGIVYYNHHWAVLRSTYDNNNKLNNFWKVIAQTTSSYNEKFVTVMQAKNYPFYAVQFHPEKSVFEWKVYSDKSYDSVQMVQIIANRFVDKARLSKNQFASNDQYNSLSIYNYQTSATNMSFTRIYVFNETKPTEVPTFRGDSAVIKIENPESSRFEHLWNAAEKKQHKHLAIQE